ncbi:MAG TPA: hypothetical protein VF590_27330, partial [Isosphaeraceae bacterium]
MPDEAAPPGLPRVDALVRAQVQEVRKDEQFNTSILRIEHIYSGQRDLIGRTFTAYTLTGSYLSGQSIDPQPTLGEVGIRSVRRVEDGITAVHPGGQGSFQWPSLFPARKGLHPRFEQAETLAEVIGAASRLPVAERPAFLRRHVTSEVSEVASWAVYALAEADPAAVDALVRGLASNDRITIGGQVA